MSRPNDHGFGLADHGITLGELAGTGGSGQVYRGSLARHDGTHTAVAVKILHDAAEVGRITREAASLKRLDHPAIARLIDVIDLRESGGSACLVTEWAEGTALSSLLRAEAPLAPGRAMAIFATLAAALDHAHGQGVVHRDVSPDNVMVGVDGAVKLIDFGLSRSADSATLTAEGITAGTPRYLAPEVIAGAAATPASDLYSAAVVLYEMLTGHWPYGDAGATIATAMHHHLNSAPIPPSEANPWLSPACDSHFDRALAKLPEQRFASVTEFSASVATSTAQSTDSVRASRRSALIGAAVAVLGGLVAVGAFLLVANSGSDSPPATVAQWPAGTAASLSCNLLAGTSFDDGQLPTIYYDGVADENEIVDFGGVDDSAALRIGITDSFGLYGETIEVSPGTGYVFSAHVSIPADVDLAYLRLFWLDENYELVRDEPDIALEGSGRVSRFVDRSPDTARYAVPSLVKEASPGSIVADELVFAPQPSECADRLVAD